MTLTRTEKLAELVDAGWRTRVDGLLRAPDPADLRAYTFAAAWDLHTQRESSADANH
jgi:hypothetical protein